jgi:hypothetical protein
MAVHFRFDRPRARTTTLRRSVVDTSPLRSLVQRAAEDDATERAGAPDGAGVASPRRATVPSARAGGRLLISRATVMGDGHRLPGVAILPSVLERRWPARHMLPCDVEGRPIYAAASPIGRAKFYCGLVPLDVPGNGLWRHP